MIAKDHTGKNTVLKLEYFSGAFALFLQKNYEQMTIHEKITIRCFYAAQNRDRFPSKHLKD